MIKKAFLFSILCLSLVACSKTQDEYAHLYDNLPFKMEKVSKPDIPSYTVDITDFGGVGDGVTLNCQAFADAIEHLSGKGGGHLNVPAGIWLTGPIGLKSNIDLHITPDAIVVFDTDRDLYPIVGTVFEGLDTRRCESPIWADGQKNISITGGGVIDGNGQDWRMVKKSKLTESEWNAKVASGGVVVGTTWYPDEGFIKAASYANMNVPSGDLSEEQWNEIKSFLRPVLISIRNCENVLLSDCTFQNSPCWNVHPLMCRNVIIDNITVRNPWYAQNGDGIDIDSCENVILVNSSFDAGDDGICIKSGKDADGRKRARPCQNLIIDNCTVFHGHGGFTVGSEMSGGVHNIKVSNCRFLGTDVGLRFKSTRGRGGVVDNIFVDNVYMKDIITDAVLFNLYYGGMDPVMMAQLGISREISDEPAFEVDETTPAFRDIHIKNVVCNGAERAMFFNGLPEMPVKGIELENVTMTSGRGIQLSWCEDIFLKNVKVYPKSGERLITANIRNLNDE